MDRRHFIIFVFVLFALLLCSCAKLRPKESMNGKWGYINRSGEYVIKPQFDMAAKFHEGIARVGLLKQVYRLPKNSYESGYYVDQLRYGYINTTGSYIVTAIYDYADDFDGGRARVGSDDARLIADGEFFFTRFGYIDRSGRVVEPLE